MTTKPDVLRTRLGDITHVPTLLVACDYDGVLAPIVSDPEKAHARPESLTALRILATLADTFVAVVSGRSLAALRSFTGLPSEIHHVGSHGSEFIEGVITDLGQSEIELRDAIAAEVTDLADTAGAAFGIEEKPASVAFHYRNADPAAAERVIEALLEGPATWPGVQVKRGKMVLELAVVTTNKGTAVETLRREVHADAVLFLGDDVTDEDVFATLSGRDVGIKVGPGETLAQLRIADPDETTAALQLLCELRQSQVGPDFDANE